MNEEFFYTMMQFSQFAVLSMVSMTVFLGAPYIMLRVRDWRHGGRDRQLGMKVALHFLLSNAVWIGVSGLMILLTLVFASGTPPAQSYSVAAGMIVAGGLLVWVLSWVIRRTNDAKFLAPRRAYCGIRMTVAWLIFAGLFTILMIRVFDGIFSDSKVTPVNVNPAFGRPRTPNPVPSDSSFLQLTAASLVWLAAGFVDFLVFLSAQNHPEVPPFDARCTACDYELAGTIAGGGSHCPECGTGIQVDQIQFVTQRYSQTSGQPDAARHSR